MKCLILGVEKADFELGVCSRAERFVHVNDQDLEKAIAKVHETFKGVENLRGCPRKNG